jgi:uncharacterized membrane protein
MSVEDAWKLVISVGIVMPTEKISELTAAQKADGGIPLEKVE